MPDPITIGVFAGNEAVTQYLREMAAHGGFPVINNIQEASILLAAGDNWAAVPRTDGQAVIWIGPAVADEGVRVFGHPVRAAQILEALARLQERHGAVPARITLAGRTVDTRENLWLQDGTSPVRLTEKEVAILCLLKESAPSSASRQVLLEKVWAYAEGVETHTIETHIYRLRQKIEDDPSNPKILITKDDGYTVSE